jgi:hypothetical protein
MQEIFLLLHMQQVFFAIKFNLKATIFSYFLCCFVEEFDADCPSFVLQDQESKSWYFVKLKCVRSLVVSSSHGTP